MDSAALEPPPVALAVLPPALVPLGPFGVPAGVPGARAGVPGREPRFDAGVPGGLCIGTSFRLFEGVMRCSDESEVGVW